jgi:hypothetical protein
MSGGLYQRFPRGRPVIDTWESGREFGRLFQQHGRRDLERVHVGRDHAHQTAIRRKAGALLSRGIGHTHRGADPGAHHLFREEALHAPQGRRTCSEQEPRANERCQNSSNGSAGAAHRARKIGPLVTDPVNKPEKLGRPNETSSASPTPAPRRSDRSSARARTAKGSCGPGIRSPSRPPRGRTPRTRGCTHRCRWTAEASE